MVEVPDTVLPGTIGDIVTLAFLFTTQYDLYICLQSHPIHSSMKAVLCKSGVVRRCIHTPSFFVLVNKVSRDTVA